MTKNHLIASLLAILAGVSLSCVTSEERRQPLKQLPSPHIERLFPSVTLAGAGFQAQPSGESAIVVTGSDFASTSRIFFNGKPLSTAFGNSTALTAVVPSELYSKPGALEVTVENPDGKRSNIALFQVLSTSGVAPQLSRLLPDSCITGRAFNVQPSGESALAVEGSNFVPGAVIYFDTSPLATAFGGPGGLTAIVPQDLLRTPRAIQVQVKNPDRKVSNPLRFAVVSPAR